MKRILCLLALLSLILSSGIALASDVSNATWQGIIRVSNSGAATSSVSVNMSCNSTSMISNGFANSTLTDVVIQKNGIYIPFMPGYGTYPWMIWVDSIGVEQNVDYDIYTGNVTGGKTRIFADGMTIDDSATMESTTNSTSILTAFIDTTMTSENITYKKDAERIRVGETSGNITVELNNTLANINPTSSTATGWSDPTQAYNDNTADYAQDPTGAGDWSNWFYLYHDQLYCTSIRYYSTAEAAGSWTIDIDALLVGDTWEDVFEGGIALGAYTSKSLGYGKNVKGARIRMKNNDAAGRDARINDFDFYGATYAKVEASGISSGEMEIKRQLIGSAQLDGTNDIINCGSTLNLGTSDYTIEVWFNSSSITTLQRLITKRESDNDRWYLAILDSKLYYYQVSGGTAHSAIATTNMTSDSWNFAGLVNDRGNRIYLYENGVDDTSGAPADTSLNLENTGNITIGGINDAGGTPFNGKPGEVRIYLRAVSATEMAEHAVGLFTDNTSLVGVWRLDEGVGTIAHDSSGNGYDGTLKNGATWAEGQALELYIGDVLMSRDYENSISVADNGNDRVIGSANTTPYIESFDFYKGGSHNAHIEWEYNTTFTDSTGNGNDATPSFVSSSSDSNVSADLVSLEPASLAQVLTFSLSASYSILTGVATDPDNMYDDEDYSKLPVEPVNEVLTEAGVPASAWWFPFLFLGICVIGMIAYGGTTMIRGPTGQLTEGQIDGSLLVMFLVMEVLLILLGKMGPIPFWPAYIFPIAGIAIILSRKHYSWG